MGAEDPSTVSSTPRLRSSRALPRESDRGDAPSRRLVVEFAGTPRAGKTSAMRGLALRLEAGGHQVRLVEERAVASPVPNRQHPHFNLWTATTTSALMLEAMYADADVVLVDRGLFDALCWMEWYLRSGHLTKYDHGAIGKFLRVRALRQLTDVVLVMTVDPDVALKRERATREPEKATVPGTIMNVDTLGELNASIAATVRQHRGEFKLQELDTTGSDQAETLEIVASAVQRLVPVPALARSNTD
jgi:thymidylate kinase